MSDTIDRLLVCTVAFGIASVVFGVVTLNVLPEPVLPWVSGVLFLLCTGAAEVCYWVWKDVRDDG